MPGNIHLPGFSCARHFLPSLGALWEEASRVGADKPLSQNEKPVERRAGAGADDGDGAPRQRLDSGMVDCHRRRREAGGFAQEGAFPRIGLDQLDPRHPHDRQHKAGKTGAAAEIDKDAGGRRNERQKLRRIEKMAPPEVAERAVCDEVDALRPLPQQPRVGFEPRQCFT